MIPRCLYPEFKKLGEKATVNPPGRENNQLNGANKIQYDRGHVFAKGFGGFNDLRNVFSQNYTINQNNNPGTFYNIEVEIDKSIINLPKSMDSVSVDFNLSYMNGVVALYGQKANIVQLFGANATITASLVLVDGKIAPDKVKIRPTGIEVVGTSKIAGVVANIVKRVGNDPVGVNPLLFGPIIPNP